MYCDAVALGVLRPEGFAFAQIIVGDHTVCRVQLLLVQLRHQTRSGKQGFDQRLFLRRDALAGAYKRDACADGGGDGETLPDSPVPLAQPAEPPAETEPSVADDVPGADFEGYSNNWWDYFVSLDYAEKTEADENGVFTFVYRSGRTESFTPPVFENETCEALLAEPLCAVSYDADSVTVKKDGKSATAPRRRDPASTAESGERSV